MTVTITLFGEDAEALQDFEFCKCQIKRLDRERAAVELSVDYMEGRIE